MQHIAAETLIHLNLDYAFYLSIHGTLLYVWSSVKVATNSISLYNQGKHFSMRHDKKQ